MASIPLRASPQFLRPAQAGDHGHPQQVLADAGPVGRDLRQAAAEVAPVGLEIALVLDRLFLDVFERHQAALPVVALELALGLAVMPDLDEARGQVDRVMNATVHAHAAQRVVDMRGVAGEERASALERLRHSLVHFVKRDVSDIVIGDAGHHRGHERLREVAAYRELVAFVRRDWKHHAAEAWNLQQEVPALGIAHVAHRDEAGNDGTEIERRADDQKALRPGEAGKFDPERAPHVAAGAVGADEPAARAHLGSPVALDRDLHARAMLRDVLDLSVELQLEIRLFAQLSVQNTRELGLLALHPIGVSGDVGDGAEIELREHAVLPAAILERRRGQSLRDQRPRGAEPIEHVERRRMEGRGARLLAEIRSRLEYRYRHAAADEVGRRHQADRPRARDQHLLLDRHDAFGPGQVRARLSPESATVSSGSYSPATSLRRRSLPTGDFGIALTNV